MNCRRTGTKSNEENNMSEYLEGIAPSPIDPIASLLALKELETPISADPESNTISSRLATFSSAKQSGPGSSINYTESAILGYDSLK